VVAPVQRRGFFVAYTTELHHENFITPLLHHDQGAETMSRARIVFTDKMIKALKPAATD
jgi:hypothetical protein